jgi:hypothetical protein
MSEIKNPYPLVKTEKTDNIVLIYDAGTGYRCLTFSKEEAIKFYANTKKEFEKKKDKCELKGASILCDKFCFQEKSIYVEPWLDMFKTELMYITGKLERPKKTYVDYSVPPVTEEVDKKEEKKTQQKLTQKEKEKAIRSRGKK